MSGVDGFERVSQPVQITRMQAGRFLTDHAASNPSMVSML